MDLEKNRAKKQSGKWERKKQKAKIAFAKL